MVKRLLAFAADFWRDGNAVLGIVAALSWRPAWQRVLVLAPAFAFQLVSYVLFWCRGAQSNRAWGALLLFPLVVPVLLAAVKATSLLILGDPMGQLGSWASLLGVFAVVHWALGGMFFERVVED